MPLLLEKIIQLLIAMDLKFVAKLECSQLAVPMAIQLGWLKHVSVCQLHSSYSELYCIVFVAVAT